MEIIYETFAHTYGFNVTTIYGYGNRSYRDEQPYRQNTYIVRVI